MTRPGVPSRDDCLIGALLDRRAAEKGDAPAVLFEDGTVLTYAGLLDRVRVVAAALQALGVGQHDRVLCWLPNGPQALTLWYGLNSLGAVFVPINTGYRGALLDHVIENSGASLMVADDRLLDGLDGRSFSRLQRIVVVGDHGRFSHAQLDYLPESSLTASDGTVSAPAEPIEPWHPMMVIYTSGTTGPSKGVLISYVQAYSASKAHYWVGEGDRALVTLPLFHIGGTWPTYRGLETGGSIAMVSNFSTGTFWETLTRTQCTNVTLVSAMVSFLLRQPASAQDRRHTLRTASIVPINADAIAFGERFGIDVYTSFGMTEISAPITCGPNPAVMGSCGRPRDGVEARIVDDNDIEVEDGRIGELVMRSDTPWAFTVGYLNNPEATARAWRNGWFHTGDAFRRDADGNYFYVDRIKDAIRRRGENISAFEVEREILQHEAVADVAVVGVRSPDGEDDVMAVVVPVQDNTPDPRQLFEFLQPRMAHFMLPRYIRFVAGLPRTHTHRVQKYLIKDVTADTWDRMEEGISVRRQPLPSR